MATLELTAQNFGENIVTDGITIVGSGQAASVFILDLGSAMYQFRGSNWSLVASAVEALRFPGN